MKFLIFCSLLFSTSAFAWSSIEICEGTTRYDHHKFKVTINRSFNEDYTVKLEVTDRDGKETRNTTFRDLVRHWDGHMSGLITSSSGLSIAYEDHYGVFRNVTITAKTSDKDPHWIETIHVDQCKTIKD